MSALTVRPRAVGAGEGLGGLPGGVGGRGSGLRLGNAATAELLLGEQGDTGVSAACPVQGAVDGPAARARAVAEAVASVPLLDGVDEVVAALVEERVGAAAKAAFDACLRVAMECDRLPVSTARTPATDVVVDAVDRYCRGPGVAVLRFGEVLARQPGGCAEDGGGFTDAQVLAAVAAYDALVARSRLAYAVQANARITLADRHPSGVPDAANADENVQDVVEGNDVHRSAYDRDPDDPPAPGGTVRLGDHVLAALDTLGRAFTFTVSELAGGQHTGGSRHYDGAAIDVTWIDGRHVSASNPSVPAFRARCAELGAVDVRGPGDPDHGTHVHAAWRRP